MLLYNKFKVVFSFLILIFSFNSCIELEEHIIINNDRSGSYAILLDLGVISNNPFYTPKIPDDVKEFPDIIKNAIGKIDGISDVKAVSTKSKYGVSFKFKNHKAFKKGLLEISGLKNYGFIIPNYIKVGKHRFVKKNIGHIIKQQIQSQEDSPLLDEYMGMKVADLINISSVIETPSKIKSVKRNITVSNAKGTNSVKIKTTLSDILNGAETGVLIKY